MIFFLRSRKMIQLQFLIVILMILNKPLVIFGAKTCLKGQKVVATRFSFQCEPCTEGTYQPNGSDSQYCLPCTQCDGNSGSDVKKKCTKDTNTICQCRGDFVAWDDDFSTCKCDIGFGLSESGECSKCKEGYFSSKENTPCKQWKECKSAKVSRNGSTTSDVVCGEELSGSHPTTLPTQKKDFYTILPNQHPHEGALTLRMLTNIATRAPQNTTSKESLQPFHPTSRGNHMGMAFAILGIVAVLVVLIAVTCRLHINPCWKKKTPLGLQTRDSTCRRPVEESGDSSESSLKLNPAEP